MLRAACRVVSFLGEPLCPVCESSWVTPCCNRYRVRVAQDVERLLVMKGTDPAVRKKAALCFLRFFRENPENLVHAEWADRMVRAREVAGATGLHGWETLSCPLSPVPCSRDEKRREGTGRRKYVKMCERQGRNDGGKAD